MKNFNKRKTRMHPFVSFTITTNRTDTFFHERGIPCRSLRCPHCDVPLLPSDYSQKSISNKKIDMSINNKKENIEDDMLNCPKVDISKCIGCGACINACPMNAISLNNHVAEIDETMCINCRKCIKICPVKAIG